MARTTSPLVGQAAETPQQLARELAARANQIRGIAVEQLGLEAARGGGPLTALQRDFGSMVGGEQPAEFADSYAQTVSYGLLAARWLGRDAAGAFTRQAALERLPSTSESLRRLFTRLLAGPFCLELLAGLDGIAALLQRTPITELFRAHEDPSVHFYEDFLDAYDPSLRRRMGVYYTPGRVVEAMVADLDGLARTELGLELGLADPIRWADYSTRTGIARPPGVASDEFVVQILDPATGTGTFLLAVLRRIFATMTAEYRRRGLSDEEAAAAWTDYVRTALLPRVHGFELLMAPCVVALLRLGVALEGGLAAATGRDGARWGVRFGRDDHLRVYLTNSLDLFGDDDRLESPDGALSAGWIKRSGAISVIVGNPPYERISVATDPTADWVIRGEVPGRSDGRSLFEDIRDVAREHTTFSHLRSLSDRYVFFWRWAVWKVFEQRLGPGLISMVSNATWLTGPGFCGLRKCVHAAADALWIVDLGGASGGPRPEPNVFGVTTPVAITSLVRRGLEQAGELAVVHYRKIPGASAEAKLEALADASSAGQAWRALESTSPLASLVPTTGDASWLEHPHLADLFPWQQPGCLASRTWPIAPDPTLLERRWQRFVSAPVAARAALFVTAKTGRNIHTQVPGQARLADLDSTAAPAPILRYALRSFDRQWILADPRLLKTESPSLWRGRSSKQLFLSTLMSAPIAAGPALTLTTEVPDFHHFRGSYGGKDVVPLYRDADGCEPNVTIGLRERLADRLAIPLPSPEQLAAYVYALLSGPSYQRRFATELATPGPRVPISADPELWARAIELGARLIWLHSYAERERDPSLGRGDRVATHPGLAWTVAITRMPNSLAEVGYDTARRELRVGDGRLAGVDPEVWTYAVSGMPVVKKWLGYRTARGAGRAARSSTALDRIRAESWPNAWTVELVELVTVLTLTLAAQPEQAALLERVCSGPLIRAAELPLPDPSQREVRRPPGARG